MLFCGQVSVVSSSGLFQSYGEVGGKQALFLVSGEFEYSWMLELGTTGLGF
jgi:hypothetical protein